MSNVASVLDYMPVGFRFRPTDEELVSHYLTNRLMGEIFVLQIIPEIDVCKHEPWDLPEFSLIKSEEEWFFFSPRDYKYSNSTRSNRATLRGFWKSTGKDRNIKARVTNEIIGTKKTLVFYKGRVPNGVKTNWVIHEYHSITFPADQRTFVLCKLMKKFEKAEGRTVCAEGEPSMVSDYEIPVNEIHPSSPINQVLNFQTPHPPDEVDLSPLLFSSIANERGSSFPFSPRLNDDRSVNLPLTTEKEDEFVRSILNLPSETTEEEDHADKFVNSIFLDDEEEVLLSRGTIASIHALAPSESLNVYWESSDTDAEVVSAQYGYIPDPSTKSNKNDGSREILRTSEVNSSELSSNQEAKLEKKGRSFHYDLDSSSADSTPARPLKINRTKHVSSASTLKTWKTQHQPRSADSVSLRAGARRSQTHRKISTKGAYHEAQNETPEHSNKNKRDAQVTDKRNTSKASSSESSGVNGRNPFIQLETPSSSSQNLSPPSVYLGNVVIGLFLFVFIIWEILSCGKFC